MQSDRARARALVAGRVQGIGFRAWTEDCALELGLFGYVRNLADGRVEVVIEGETPAVEHMLALLAEGPRAARVTRIEVEKEPWRGEFTAFACR